MKKTTLKDVLNIIDKWQKDNDVIFYGGFIEFNKKGDVKADRMCAFGEKKALKIALQEFNKMFKENKNEFINW